MLAVQFMAHYALGIFVRGDSFQAYSAFNYAYGNFLSAGEFPQWFPHAAYGSPAEVYMTTFLGPFQVLMILLAAPLRVANAWLLFCGATFAECAVYVACAYLLGKSLYKSEEAASAVATWTALTLYWNVQVFWPHRALVYIPLMLLFTLRFHRSGDLRELVRIGLVLCISVLGNNAYTGPLYVLLVCVFFAALCLLDRKNGFARLARPGTGALVEFGLLLLLGGLYLFLIHKAFDGAAFAAPDRDPVTGATSLRVFLTYGGSAIEKLPDFVIGRSGCHMQFFFYLGVSATGLALYALRRVRGGVFAALAATSLFLLLLSLGPFGGVAYAAYWFPGMNRFRHLSYLLPMLRLLLLIIAGYGLDHVLEKPRERAADAFVWLMFGALGILAAKDFWLGWNGLLPEFGFLLLLAVRVGYGVLHARWPRRAGACLGFALALAVALELGVANHQLLRAAGSFYSVAERRAVGGRLDAYLVQPQPFQAGREASLPLDSRALFDLYTRQAVNNYTTTQFVDQDFCAPAVRIDYAMPGVLELLERAAPGALARTNEERDVVKALGFVYWRQALAQQWFREAVGCGGGRLALETPQGARRDVASGVRHFSANRLVADVNAGPEGGMLFYADAYHPGWRAWVDGLPATVERAHGAFKSVAVPPGAHRVAFAFFNPWREWARRLLAVVATLVVVWLLLAAVRSRPSHSC
ncbi:MAG: YfhO family protein [Humidesulfovibrio sp.]|nr:YfhO family protein [Humidesulfovibrio sp.]